MGYESRIYVVNLHRNRAIGNKVFWAEKIAMFNLSSMRGNWCSLFNRPIEYELYEENGDDKFDTDNYGDHLKDADINSVIQWLEKECKRSDYRRLRPALALLKEFNQSEWEELRVVHFGY